MQEVYYRMMVAAGSAVAAVNLSTETLSVVETYGSPYLDHKVSQLTLWASG